MIDTRFGEARLLDFLPDKELPAATLLELTGDASKADASQFPSGLVKRVAKAWVTPLTDLTCGQYRMLVGQRFGLQWLSAPAATFVARYPFAECDLYPGDLSVNALIAWRQLIAFAPEETREMIRADFAPLFEMADEEQPGSILLDAVAALEQALSNVC
jgi:hypothetical protein